VRTNLDYVFVQPIYNQTQREALWDLEAAFMPKKDFNVLMDQIIERELLEGNTAQTPKKKVRIMVCADFEDSHICEEKFFHFTPKHIDDLPPFRLCHPRYWQEDHMPAPFEVAHKRVTPQYQEINAVENGLMKIAKQH